MRFVVLPHAHNLCVRAPLTASLIIILLAVSRKFVIVQQWQSRAVYIMEGSVINSAEGASTAVSFLPIVW